MCILLLSGLLRFFLALSGGQFYWADEIRFYQAQLAAQIALSNDFSNALSPKTLSIEHIGYKLITAALEYARLKMGLGVTFTFLVFSQFSTLNIFLIWRMAKRLDAPDREALYSALLMACSGSMLIFSRHLVPYDVSLSAWLAAMVLVCGEKPGPVALAASGFLSILCFLSYNGSWLLLPVLLVVYVLRQGFTLRTLVPGAAIMGAGAAIAFAALGFTGRTAASAFQEFKVFSKTITMGDYAEGWSFPLEYLWHCDGPLLLLQLLGTAFLAVIVARGGGLREKIYLSGLAITYLLLAGSAAVLELFVVYGRTARLLEPFLCLVGGWFTARFLAVEGSGRTRLAVTWTVLLAVGVHNMLGPFSLVFKDRFEKTIDAQYGKFRTMPTFAIRETGVLTPEPPTCPEAVIAREPLPTSYMPYRYEGTSRQLRAFMATQAHEYVFFKCRFDLPCLKVDFTNGKVLADVATTGLGEMSLHGDREALWAMGPDTVLEFWEHDGRKTRLCFELLAVVAPELDVEVWINGTLQTSFALERGKIHPGKTISIVFDALPGLNQVRFRFSKWNGIPEKYITSDPRPFAAAFPVLRIETDQCAAK